MDRWMDRSTAKARVFAMDVIALKTLNPTCPVSTSTLGLLLQAIKVRRDAALHWLKFLIM